LIHNVLASIYPFPDQGNYHTIDVPFAKLKNHAKEKLLIPYTMGTTYLDPQELHNSQYW